MNPDTPIPLEQFRHDATIRWSCRAGDLIAWFRWTDIFARPEKEPDVLDVWQMRDGDFVTITNRTQDLPSWFELHPTEVCDALVYEMMDKLENGYTPGEIIDGPNLWRIRAGDRLAWVGEPRIGYQSECGLLSILDFKESALAIGDTDRTQTLEDIAMFGACSPDEVGKGKMIQMQDAANTVRDMGFPSTLAVDWKLR